MLWCLTLLALCAAAQGRAVNISNTWVLPEEGFPVFYRYFRDRISWYEADAVCQFHHANLVTVDTTAQYDAVRAYLKELDISSAVWVGLIRSNQDGDFTWTDYRGLSGDGYWSSAPDSRDAPLCAAADPAADYRWEARACGGPTVASFICELPVPQWALGAEGCMVRALPALTVLYLPESAAVQLTADCGLAGVKKVQCNGNVKREDLLKELSCFEYSEEDTGNNFTTVWPSQSTAMETDASKDTVTTEDNIVTESNKNTQTYITSGPTLESTKIGLLENSNSQFKIKLPQNNKINPTRIISLNKNVNLDVMQNNNLQSNDIPKLISDDDLYPHEKYSSLDDEQMMQHKILHDELARRGNFETIFTQPTDHFVPPLVMAKAKLSDDMTVISLEEKHAHQLVEERAMKQKMKHIVTLPVVVDKPQVVAVQEENSELQNTGTNYTVNTNDHNNSNVSTLPIPDTDNKENTTKVFKYGSPKKYTNKMLDFKNKNGKSLEHQVRKNTDSLITKEVTESSTSQTYNIRPGNVKPVDDNSIDLKVLIKEPKTTDNSLMSAKEESTNKEIISTTQRSTSESDNNTTKTTEHLTERNIVNDKPEQYTHEVIKLTILNAHESTATPTTFKFTTKIPVEVTKHTRDNDDRTNSPALSSPTMEFLKYSVTTNLPVITAHVDAHTIEDKTQNKQTTAHPETSINYTTASSISQEHIEDVLQENNTVQFKDLSLQQSSSIDILSNITNNDTDKILSSTASIFDESSGNVDYNNTENYTEQNVYFTDGGETSETINNFQSSLLSGINEPPPKPKRSRRPQKQPNRKFNPFRILG